MNYFAVCDIVPMLENITNAFQPFAKSQNVHLEFKSDISSLVVRHDPQQVSYDVSQILSRVIPTGSSSEKAHVSVLLRNSTHHLIIQYENPDQVNLDEIRHISGLKVSSLASGLEIEFENIYTSDSPLEELTTQIHPSFKGFHREVKNKLIRYFDNLERQVDSDRGLQLNDALFMKKIHAVLQENIANPGLDITELSQALATNRTRLFKRMKGLVGLPPGKYIRAYRLQKARELLESTNLLIGDIATRTGFVSQSHFTRSFQQKFSHPPSFFRIKPFDETNSQKGSTNRQKDSVG